MYKQLFSFPDVWYVNADGQEGWVPFSILELVMDEVDSSRESTPNDLLSEVSAESSELSDEGEQYISCG
jgi:translation initiation factor 2B subunit (eIF-2B alpha/beta/delta family)